MRAPWASALRRPLPASSATANALSASTGSTHGIRFSSSPPRTREREHREQMAGAHARGRLELDLDVVQLAVGAPDGQHAAERSGASLSRSSTSASPAGSVRVSTTRTRASPGKKTGPAAGAATLRQTRAERAVFARAHGEGHALGARGVRQAGLDAEAERARGARQRRVVEREQAAHGGGGLAGVGRREHLLERELRRNAHLAAQEHVHVHAERARAFIETDLAREHHDAVVAVGDERVVALLERLRRGPGDGARLAAAPARAASRGRCRRGSSSRGANPDRA